MSDAPVCPFKLAIRTNLELGIVTASVTDLAGKDLRSGEAYVLGTVSIAALQGRDDPLFKAWHKLMFDLMSREFTQATGIRVEGGTEFDPADLENKPNA